MSFKLQNWRVQTSLLIYRRYIHQCGSFNKIIADLRRLNKINSAKRKKHSHNYMATKSLIPTLANYVERSNTASVEDISTSSALYGPLLSKSFESRQYILKDFRDLILAGDVNKIREAVAHLIENNHLSTNEWSTYDEKALTDYQECYVKCLLDMGEIENATIFMLHLYREKAKDGKEGTRIVYKHFPLLLQVASNASVRYFPQNAYCILQLLNNFDKAVVESKDLYRSLLYLSSSTLGNYFANYLFFKLWKDGSLQVLSSQQLADVVESMLSVNIDNGDSIKAMEVWNITYKHLSAQVPYRNIRKISSLLIALVTIHHNTTTLLELLVNLPTVFNTLDMVDFKISFYADHDHHLFRTTVQDLKTPLRRTSLTGLLKGYLALGDEKTVQKVVDTIKLHSLLNAKENELLIKMMWSKGKFDECKSKVKSLNLDEAKLAYLFVFSKVAGCKDCKFFNDLYNKFSVLPPNDHVREQFTIEVLKRICKVNLRQAIRYYIKFVRAINQQIYKSNAYYLKIDLERYNLPNSFVKLLHLTPAGMVECLKILARLAVYHQDKVSLKWTIDELRRSGWDFPSIIEYLRAFDNANYLHQVLKPRLLQ